MDKKTIDTNLRGGNNSNEILDFDGSQISSAERLSMKGGMDAVKDLKSSQDGPLGGSQVDQDVYYSQTAAVSQKNVTIEDLEHL
mmetsp:Transcript_3418/g.4521  ORF Transcript_3418/g.4521 Transcript_3418/m.4521 type:complete len:84 (+) Transcript_3418:1240-1491(+)|eukprot:CAMPEP_0185605174 /NCGR_PEP_ID=MMETSP0436-20130131/3841_1 /TAXON_ID=626734 ORGANISM="Favella taraikaensis, Strain Fe Narragansett Bay" /NCGR_SAMPLE_ID=MMETSP0436 /ASSEMBLY_ACC=CAM_ASM_000390 /LENGTH=83 /DNA_ID=CAMNT_0028236281 /DNA_START=1270 /DNA_END=1521 /DNA_ORIENTATION=+